MLLMVCEIFTEFTFRHVFDDIRLTAALFDDTGGDAILFIRVAMQHFNQLYGRKYEQQ